MSAYAPVYSMSRAALNAFTRILAHTYRGDGVLVNAVDPGWVHGPGRSVGTSIAGVEIWRAAESPAEFTALQS